MKTCAEENRGLAQLVKCISRVSEVQSTVPNTGWTSFSGTVKHWSMRLEVQKIRLS